MSKLNATTTTTKQHRIFERVARSTEIKTGSHCRSKAFKRPRRIIESYSYFINTAMNDKHDGDIHIIHILNQDEDDVEEDENDTEAESLIVTSQSAASPKSAMKQLASEFKIDFDWAPLLLRKFKYPLILLIISGLVVIVSDWANVHVNVHIELHKGSGTPTAESSTKSSQSTNISTTDLSSSDPASKLPMTMPVLPTHTVAPSTLAPALPPVDPNTLPYYKINDPTIELDKAIDHPWVRYHIDSARNEKPKLRLVLTDFGWNHPDTTDGLSYFRTKRSRELLQGYLDHPYFDPTFRWTEHLTTPSDIDTDPSVQTIILMDLESCFENNYPFYTGTSPRANADLEGGRAFKSVPNDPSPCYFYDDCYPYMEQVLQSPIMAQGDGHFIFIDCTGHWTWDERFPMTVRHANLTTTQLSFVSISVTYEKIREDSDMGLPPPAIHPIQLKADEIRDIRTCQSEDSDHRYFYLSFIGADRKDDSPREELFKLSNDRDVLLMKTNDFNKKYQGGHTFDEVSRRSRFAATPRGDCLFSYRFHEVLSAGAIPVVYADGWVLGFRKELVDWTKCAVVIPENDIAKTLDILRGISDEKRCEMRNYCYDIYTKYLSTPAGTIVGIVDSVLAMKAQRKLDGSR